MLKIENLHFGYGKHPAAWVLRGASLELADGEIGILLGRNGSGKTTLFKNVLSVVTPRKGNVYFDSEDLFKMPRRERAKRIAYVPQNITFGELTVFDSVLMGRVAHFGMKAGEEDYAVTREILEEMGISALAERNADNLSGGEKQKVAIARAIAQEARMMIIDEPTGNLDIANGRLLIEEAKKLAREKNIGILCTLHDLNQALEMGDKFFFMKDGVIKYSGGEEVFTEAVIEEIFGVRMQIIEACGRKIVIGGTDNEN